MDEVVQIGTALIAFYGAVFSTVLFFRQKRLDRPKIEVSHAFHYAVAPDRKRDAPPAALLVQAVNSGRQELVVTHLALEIPGFTAITPSFLTLKRGNRKSRYNRPQLDKARLRPGDMMETSFDYAQLLAMLDDHGIDTPLQVRGLCYDTLGNFFSASWHEIGREER